MRVLKRDRRTGEIKLLVESADDLWHMYNIIEAEDLVRAVTYRREEKSSDKLRSERGEKKRVFLGIRVEKTEFHDFSDWLRIHGVIEEGPQDIGSYHTINLSPGDDLAIVKTWSRAQLRRIDDAESSKGKDTIVFLAIDDDEAVIALVREYGIQKMADFKAGSRGKQYKQKSEVNEYLAEVAEALVHIAGDGDVLIVGPGFAKEGVLDVLRQKWPDTANKAHLVSTGQSGMAAIQEVMKKGDAAKALEGSRVAREVRLIEQLMEEVSKDGLFAYGERDVKQCLQSGAIEKILVTDSAVREKKFDIIESAEDMGAEVIVISTSHEGGQRLEAIGGIGALLRYRAN